MGCGEDLIRELRDALKEAEETFALMAQPAMVDPRYGAIVAALGDLIGYGALMSSASASWRQKGLSGGEFVAGPCYVTVVSVLGKVREALARADAALNSGEMDQSHESPPPASGADDGLIGNAT